MLVDRQISDYFGSPSGPLPASSVEKVVIFVEIQLVIFSQRYAGSTIKNEKGLTQELCLLLNRNARKEGCPFWFDKEYMEEVEKGNSPQVDIAVISDDENLTINSKHYNRSEAFFAMEAKRLSRLAREREKEYLVGRMEGDKYKDCGGVERFKKNIHGKGLQYGAMIGYVQKYQFDYWLSAINSWIDELLSGKAPSTVQWSEKDKLKEMHRSPETARFRSENSRQNTVIHLYHLWVNLLQ